MLILRILEFRMEHNETQETKPSTGFFSLSITHNPLDTGISSVTAAVTMSDPMQDGLLRMSQASAGK
jgi:hypothetical protein